MDYDEEEVATDFFPTATFTSDLEEDDVIVDSEWRLAKLGTLQSRIESLYSVRFANGSTKIPLRLLLSVANEIFGYNGWSTELVDLDVVSETGTSGNFTVVCIAKIRITLQDGSSSLYSGEGIANNLSRSIAYSTAKKAAITDATRNAILRLPHTTHDVSR